MQNGLNKRKRIMMLAGGVAGGALSLVTSLMMDLLFADSLQGTWREAVAMDMERYFSITISPDGLLAWVLFILIMAFMVAIGAAIGAVFGLIVHKFLALLES